ncbi:MAG: hypothetical protein JSR34_12845 [Proteobacteria bacterium]|nr:hypothetical protein [Pseudomonadota bacterium]
MQVPAQANVEPGIAIKHLPGKEMLAYPAARSHNRGMKILQSCLILGAFGLLAAPIARADDAVYRCESPAGVSIQSQPCPKGAVQKKIPFSRPSDPVVAPQAAAPAAPVAPPILIAGHPVTAPNAMRGPNQPYPLWQCMRGDGSTYDSRDGVPGRRWVTAKPEQPDADTAADTASGPSPEAQKAALAQQVEKSGGTLVRPYQGPEVTVLDNAAHRDAAPPPPAGAGPGQWVADQCQQLPPEQACKRYAARRDALRRQIYAARPSDRDLYAPEEQDLTTMLYAACGM